MNKKQTKRGWMRCFKNGVDADSWGQALEAMDEYEKLIKSIEFTLQNNELPLITEEKTTVLKIKLAVGERISAIDKGSGGISLDEVKKLTKVFEDLFSVPIRNFPVQVNMSGQAVANDVLDEADMAEIDTNSREPVDQKSKAEGGTLLNPRDVPGSTTLEVFIEKIGLKDAQTYIDAHITVSVVDPTGNQVSERQDTPNCKKMKPNYVTFEQVVHVQTPLETLAEGHCIFFEFKHYKPKKKKVSTRCFAFMEYDEIVKNNGRIACLELYKKPTDFTRKRLNLHTIKKLYLHVQVNIQNH